MPLVRLKVAAFPFAVTITASSGWDQASLPLRRRGLRKSSRALFRVLLLVDGRRVAGDRKLHARLR